MQSSKISNERIKTLIELVNKSERRSPERDLYTIELWTREHSLERLEEIFEFILHKTYIHKDVTKISEFVDAIKDKGIDIKKSELMNIFYFYNEAIIKDIGIRERSPEMVNEKLKNLECPSDIREIIYEMVKQNKEKIVMSAIRKDLNLLISKVMQMDKKLKKIKNKNNQQRSPPREKYI